MLAIIGPNWLKVTDTQGRRRLDDRNDFVRLEIAAALQRNIRVVPVLVGGAVMPKAEDLPQGLESLARRQAHELSDPRWDFDVGQLVETLERGGIKPSPRPPAPSNGSWWRRNKIAVGVGVAVLMIGGYVYSELEDHLEKLFSRSAAISPATLPGFPGANSPADMANTRSQKNASVNEPVPLKRPDNAPPSEPARRPLSYRGFDAIGRYPTLVQVLNPG